ncbi:hypothetical protein [Lutibacter maritimus]|uniref:Uncharacterized protein n=1 Tax=Lutibacter maritimus TaxID=593133 RepID=A0A1I6NRR4_9FLAO|nr:hypothetical protein [Lutibacter maritimus]SFS30686.1 hypothetical protein SAMN04488006_0471 [Lutibacter maritimus]
MSDFQNKFLMYIDYLKRKLKRRKESFKDLQDLIDSGSASPMAKQRYFEMKGRIEELEDDVDAAEGLLKKEE